MICLPPWLDLRVTLAFWQVMALNVVEDVRIDRLIQRRYPVCVRTMLLATPKWRDDLFEVSEDENLDERSFLIA